MNHDHDHDKHILDTVSDRFLEHIYNREFVGELDDPDGCAEMVGSCGDSIGLHVGIREGIIEKIAAQPRGCAYTVACADAACFLAVGRTLDSALTLEPEDVAEELRGLPDDHMHCARLALNTLGEAIADHLEKTGKNNGKG